MDMNKLLDLSSLQSSLFQAPPEPSRPPPPIPAAAAGSTPHSSSLASGLDTEGISGKAGEAAWNSFQSAPMLATPAAAGNLEAPFPSDATASHPLLTRALAASSPSQREQPPVPGVSRSLMPGAPPAPWQAAGEGAVPTEPRNALSVGPQRRVSDEDVPASLAGLQALARRGSWRAVLDRARAGKQASAGAGASEEHLAYATLHILALMKLRMYGAAADELRDVGDLSAPHLRYEAHPKEFPGQTGSMVPFALRWLSAELMHRMGRSAEALDQLYELLSRCDLKMRVLREEQAASPVQPAAVEMEQVSGAEWCSLKSAAESPGGLPSLYRPGASKQGDAEELCDDLGGLDHAGGVGAPDSRKSKGLSLWTRRQELVLYTALNHHVADRNFLAALQLCQVLVRRRPQDPMLLSKLGYTQLQMGDVEGARAAFARVEAAAGRNSPGDARVASLVRRNRGLLLFALKEYTPALTEFDQVLQVDPTDAAAHNNKALCLMYARDLVGAIRVLEEALQPQRCPLNETLVRNLCSMYELASTSSAVTKKNLSNWLMRVAPDDFDLTCTRL